MEFDFRKFLLDGYLDAVGKQADYWVIMNSKEDYKAGILTTEDMAKIQEAIKVKNAPPVEAELLPEPVKVTAKKSAKAK